MNLRKNAFSYFAWLVLLFFTGATCAFFGLILSQYIHIDMIFIAGGLVTIFFAVVFVLYLLIGKLSEHKTEKNDYLSMLNLTKTFESILVIALLCVGLVLRVAFMSHAGEEAAYFEVSKVTGQNGILLRSVQGSVYLYCMLLHGLFRVVGNQWIAGIWLQIFLQLIGAYLAYSGVKKLLSKVPALLVMGFILFAPISIKAALTYSPQMLYFCIFAFVFNTIAGYIVISMQTEVNKKFACLFAVLTGILIGFVCYLDISGFVLLFFPAVLPMVIREKEDNIWIKSSILMILVSILTLFAALWIDSLISNTSITAILEAWGVLYGGIKLNLEVMTSRLSSDFIVLIALACSGCFSFWRKDRTERFTPYILMAIVMGILVFAGITTVNMDGSYLLHFLLAVLASVSVTEMFASTDVRKSEYDEEIEVVEIKEEKKIEYIDNPLPLPKKHVRKTMDYAFIPEDDQMKYDIAVSDSDDFDLK